MACGKSDSISLYMTIPILRAVINGMLQKLQEPWLTSQFWIQVDGSERLSLFGIQNE